MVKPPKEIPASLRPWTKADTMDYLSANPLPTDFKWRRRDGELVSPQPTYAISNYGKWLHDTPYFQGLFELVHELVLAAGSTLPDVETLVAQLDRIRKEREGQMNLF